MAWAKLHDGFWSDPDLDRVGNEAAGVFARMISYCCQHGTNGHVSDSATRFITTKRRPLDALMEVGWIERNGSGFVIPKFLDYNPSAEEVEAKREARSKAGQKGGLASGKVRSK